MPEIFSQIHSPVDCSARNRTIGVVLQRPALEIAQALKDGKHAIERTASYFQKNNRDVTGCAVYAEENVTIFYDSDGNAIGYDLPGVDPDTILNFTLVAGLVPYGADIQGNFVGTHTDGEPDTLQVIDDFNTLDHSVYKDNRRLLPPDRIIVNNAAYEVMAITICNNLRCVSNTGQTEIDPFPIIK